LCAEGIKLQGNSWWLAEFWETHNKKQQESRKAAERIF